MPKVHWEDNNLKKIPTWINTSSYRNSVEGAWKQQCYLGNKFRNVFQCVLLCSICMQNLNEFAFI